MTNRVLIIGAFDFEGQDCGGQPVKTRELYYLLCSQYGKDSVNYIDTTRLRKEFITTVFHLIRYVRSHDVIIILPAQKGVLVYPRILQFLKRKETKLFYDVIGGWLPTKLEANPKLARYLKNYDGIWVETSSMQNALNKRGYENVITIPNFRQRKALKTAVTPKMSTPLELCTFSRVNEMKGIGDAIKAVIEINENYLSPQFKLDIYGPVEDDFKNQFKELLKLDEKNIKYCGEVRTEDGIETLKNYYALIFPTKFYTEGIPGTIIDAYSAGVPVITSIWLNSGDVFTQDKTGIGYKFGSFEGLVESLKYIANNPNYLLNMRENCLEMANRFSPDGAWTIIRQQIEKE